MPTNEASRVKGIGRLWAPRFLAGARNDTGAPGSIRIGDEAAARLVVADAVAAVRGPVAREAAGKAADGASGAWTLFARRSGAAADVGLRLARIGQGDARPGAVALHALAAAALPWPVAADAVAAARAAFAFGVAGAAKAAGDAALALRAAAAAAALAVAQASCAERIVGRTDGGRDGGAKDRGQHRASGRRPGQDPRKPVEPAPIHRTHSCATPPPAIGAWRAERTVTAGRRRGKGLRAISYRQSAGNAPEPQGCNRRSHLAKSQKPITDS